MNLMIKKYYGKKFLYELNILWALGNLCRLGGTQTF